MIVHTGQHYDREMSALFFDELKLPRPAYNLKAGGGSWLRQLGTMLPALDTILAAEKPDMVLVYGDTTSTLAGALAATARQIPLAHIEAGMRSFNRAMPEENNRVITDHLSQLLFCSTRTAVDNLRAEGIRNGVINAGDVMYDAFLALSSFAKKRASLIPSLGLSPGQYILATIHRQSNVDVGKNLSVILSALERIGAKLPVVFPIHPRTRARMSEFGLSFKSNRIHAIKPAGFLDMMALQHGAALVLTDSGGVQKEAYFHRVPCVTVRTETEWTETVRAGWNRLCGANSVDAIVRAVAAQMHRSVPRKSIRDYGDGHAAGKIIAGIDKFLEKKT